MSAADQGGGNVRAPVRVVMITTQYIETDAANFKSVVQRLTGKHSHHIHSNRELQPPPKRRRLSPLPSASEVATSTGGIMGASSSDSVMNLSSLPSLSVKFSRGVSVSDLDRLHTLPSWEEISQLCM